MLGRGFSREVGVRGPDPGAFLWEPHGWVERTAGWSGRGPGRFCILSPASRLVPQPQARQGRPQ